MISCERWWQCLSVSFVCYDRTSKTIVNFFMHMSMPAVNCFTNSSRLRRCEEKSPEAKPLLRKHARALERGRREFLSRARFDDDWLFFKFNIEDSV